MKKEEGSDKISKSIRKDKRGQGFNKNRQYQQNKANECEVVNEKYQWDFDELAIIYPSLNKFVHLSERGCSTIDWTNPIAHLTLNQAILAVEFKILFWQMPIDQLIPAIPSRLNYLQWVHDKIQLLEKAPNSSIQQQKVLSVHKIKGIDIGTGASLIYPILGCAKYNWNFIATDTSEISIENARNIVNKNKLLKDKIDLRFSSGSIFEGVISPQDGDIAFSMSNPPFFESQEDKTYWKNAQMHLNEYVAHGGEVQFIKKMFQESIQFAQQIKLFTSLVGRHKDFEECIQFLQTQKNIEIFQGSIIQGNTTRWIIAWKFHSFLQI